jgi:outer membrane protein OmpU
MNNLKKIGISALAGSLAMTAANAVEVAVTGDALISYSSERAPGDGEGANGKNFAMDSDLYFNAGGELDNGWNVSFFTALNTHSAVSNSSSQVTIGMGSLGTFQLNNKAGSKANGIDDVMPAAHQESWDRIATDNPSFFGADTASGSIDYRIPTQELMGATINFAITYDPSAEVGAGNASTTGSGVGVPGKAYVLQVAASGLEVGLGTEIIDNSQGLTTGSDEENTTAYIKYAMGPITVGYQEAYGNQRNGDTVEGADEEAEFWAIAYTQDNLSISYAESEVGTKAASNTAADSKAELTAIQAAYTMGAMTISGSFSDTDNSNNVAAQEYEETQIALSFAF